MLFLWHPHSFHLTNLQFPINANIQTFPFLQLVRQVLLRAISQPCSLMMQHNYHFQHRLSSWSDSATVCCTCLVHTMVIQNLKCCTDPPFPVVWHDGQQLCIPALPPTAQPQARRLIPQHFHCLICKIRVILSSSQGRCKKFMS